ncbi:MAG: hypothetical protein Q8O76_07850, partial [Chloroflexota bacterium]|nr:hypothetical protein [Chloroflexota bacterium]
GELHEHVDVKGIYVAEVTFDSAGPWRFTADVALPDGTTTSVQDAFQVLRESQTPAVGSPAPRSDNPTLSDVADISKIDSSDPPRVLMHTMSIADAIATGKPVVVAFATPAFCQSRVCGPAMDIMDELYDKYKDQAIFVHVEPYELDVLRQESRFELTEATRQRNLPSEPWIFVVDRKGLVAAKFEGIAALEEIEGALQPVLAGG